MVAAILLCSAMLEQAASPARDLSADLKAYQEAKADVGRTAADQVKLALWCEAHGLAAERLTHLTRATLLDPANPTARGLLGQVSYNGKWERPDQVRTALEHDPEARAAMQEYNHRRAGTADTADAQQRLAQWCDQNGLKDQATAHYQAVLRIDPEKEAVWKKLGYKKANGRWARPEDLTAEKAEADAQKHADKHWKSVLEKYRDGLSSRDNEKRRQAEDALAEITDPRAVPTIWAAFVRDDARLQQRAVEVLARIDGPPASRALASLAVYSDFAEIRGQAARVLARRDPHDFLDLLLSLIHQQFRYEAKPVNGAGTEGEIFASGERYNVRRQYRTMPFDSSILPPRLFAPGMPFNPGLNPTLAAAIQWNGAISGIAATSSLPAQLNAVPGLAQAVGESKGSNTAPGLQAMVLNSELEAIQRDRQIASILEQQRQMDQYNVWQFWQDVEAVKQTNEDIREIDDRVLPIVKTVTGQDFGTDQDAWKSWWSDEIGYTYRSSSPKVKPTYTFMRHYSSITLFSHSCFAAGTPVHTLAGPKPIESIQIGDRVLSQDATTGAVSYQPVLVVHHNPPAPLLKLTLGSETILATGIHRFWKVGKGWTMARDLKPGDVVRTLGGSLALEAVDPAGVAPVFNLDVAENRDFFVGENGFLVYDFSVVQPVARPFDGPAVADLGGSGAR